MPGTVLSISVEIGDSVSTGDDVCLLESMKMRQVLRSDIEGTVGSILVVPGESILGEAPILELFDV
jgi:biotin carboxyl carrier protein